MLNKRLAAESGAAACRGVKVIQNICERHEGDPMKKIKKDNLKEQAQVPEKKEEALSEEKPEKKEEALSGKKPEKKEEALSEEKPEKKEEALSEKKPEKKEEALSEKKPEKKEEALSEEKPEKKEEAISEEKPEKKEEALSEEKTERVSEIKSDADEKEDPVEYYVDCVSCCTEWKTRIKPEKITACPFCGSSRLSVALANDNASRPEASPAWPSPRSPRQTPRFRARRPPSCRPRRGRRTSSCWTAPPPSSPCWTSRTPPRLS